ncbi:hypothetical protein Pmani_035790 [Petrolisthes manimaculis]|uniref:Uncharacterized protein n=1 Tax=Petrolisthes manimaculis TaxID=1843537 RepID=A0AAE1TMU3_9EUCA|nr:hypothetical protein Pmani_035790 [Petrolisthes manimaculis]
MNSTAIEDEKPINRHKNQEEWTVPLHQSVLECKTKHIASQSYHHHHLISLGSPHTPTSSVLDLLTLHPPHQSSPSSQLIRLHPLLLGSCGGQCFPSCVNNTRGF